MFSGLESGVIDVVERFGYVGIGGLVALETVFPPLPSEIILPLGGFTAAKGDLNVAGVIASATIGSIVGALILYWIGHLFGRQRLYALVDQYGRFALLRRSDLDKAFDWFERHCGTAVIVGRLVPGVRSLVSLPAGVTRMSLGPFILYTATGSAIWNGALVGAGWALGSRWETVAGVVNYFQYVVILLVVAAAVWFLRSRRARMRAWGAQK